MIYVVSGAIILSAILAVILRNPLLSVFSLATVSMFLAILFYQLGAPVAGAFELSVGAGLITILIVLTLTFIQPKSDKSTQAPILLIIIGSVITLLFFVVFMYWLPQETTSAATGAGNWLGVGEVLWKTRSFDLFPVALVIFAAVFGILALLRKQKETIQ